MDWAVRVMFRYGSASAKLSRVIAEKLPLFVTVVRPLLFWRQHSPASCGRNTRWECGSRGPALRIETMVPVAPSAAALCSRMAEAFS